MSVIVEVAMKNNGNVQRMPIEPVSAYALFFRDTQAAIKGTSPNASFGEVSKIVASMWDSLDADHKNVYKKKTEAAKKEYLKALAAYRASLVSKQAPGSITSPGGAASPGGGPQPQQQHSPQQQQPQQVATQQQAGQQQQQQTGQTQQQQQQPQQQAQQQGGGQPQQAGGAPPQQGAQQGQQPPQQGSGGGGQQGAMGQQHLGCPSSGPNCIRSGCTNPAVHNPEWEDEYCSNECVVSHCRDVFSNWVASNHHQPINPTYPAPVK
ncbi:hypothetical protein Pmani_026452 [Petrolisthes manimaculis]|uniref:HMG box domain-containing protein n=1 Tax=Petrolisthes manimaculis TaxID=1843537 RepID=A0AAE1P4L9_9EUCA|nr:hypothetical protein Pmani_026452 [Petrolisthes manimaculis]